jgi:hypothetical protein
MIIVKAINNTTFEVTVEGRKTTTHEVTVDPDYYKKLTDGRVAAEVLIQKSFEFLLERESNTSILRRFDLPVIERYFPDYGKVIRMMLE